MEMSVYYLSGIVHVTMGYEKGKCLVYINVHVVHYEQIWIMKIYIAVTW